MICDICRHTAHVIIYCNRKTYHSKIDYRIKLMSYLWTDLKTLKSHQFLCGYCGKDVSSEKAYWTDERTRGGDAGRIYICHHCTRPTFFDSGQRQFPGALFGDSVSDISDPLVESLYQETKLCIGATAYTSAVLASRKLLMHIAVAKGAKENQSFAFYVHFFSDQGFVPPDAKPWVDHIREKGNEATHEIILMKREDAEEIVSFVGMLLKIIFEFPAAVAKKYTKKP